MASMSESADEILQLTQEAFKLASTAQHFDKMQNYVGACDYYDKCLLNMDEILNKLHPDSAEWRKLYDIRTKYDDRMELLREADNSNSFSLTALAGGKETKSSSKLPRSKRKLLDAETDFKDIDCQDSSLEASPEDPVEVTYWLLRNIKSTMNHGGFLTKDIFIPKRIWMQHDVKFSGLSAKSAAFDIIIKLLASHTDALYFSVDEDSLDLADAGFNYVYEELVVLQNNLSKPFPYIKELKIHDSSKDDSGSDHGNGGQSTGGNKGSGGSGRPATLSSFVSSFGKNVRKYAEVGFHRLAVALPSKLSAEELEEYVALVTKLCEKCQILNTWYEFIKTAQVKKAARSGYTPPALASTAGAGTGEGAGGAGADGQGRPRAASHSTESKLESIRGSLTNISAALRDIVVEILFRDLEYLVDKYMTDMRKAFSRMYWDEDADTHEG